MKVLALTVSLYLSISFTYAQTQFIDSLTNELQNTHHDTIRFKLLQNLSFQYASIDSTHAFLYGNQAKRLADSLNDKKLIGKAHYALAISNFYIGSMDECLAHLDTTEAIGTEYLGKKNMLSVYNLFGIAYGDMNKLQKAIESYQKGVSLAEKGSSLLADLYMNIGVVHSQVYRDEEAMNYFHKAKKIYETNDDSKFQLANLYVNIGDIGNQDSALYYYESASKIYEQYEAWFEIGTLLYAIGNYHFKKGAHDLALSKTSECITYFSEGGFPEYLVKSHYLMGEIYNSINQPSKAIVHLSKARELTVHDDLMLHSLFLELSKAYSQLNQHEKAYTNLKAWSTYSDSLHSAKFHEYVSESDFKYQNEQQARELAQQQLELAQQENQRNLIIISSILVIMIVAALFVYFRNKERLKKKNAEVELEKERLAKAQLEEFNELRSRFFANISHEFRTPLTLIKNPLESSLLEHSESFSKYKKIMLRNCGRLEQLIDQLLDLSRLESGKVQLNNQKADLTKFLQTIASAFESMASQKLINYEIAIPADHYEASFDPDKLEKIINNLLSNAFKFTDEGGTVNLETKVSSGYLQIVVNDSGIGMSSQEKEKIFERFYQVETSDNRNYEGSGIGLSLTSELVDLMNGSIQVESTPGKGSSFKVKLPMETLVITIDSETELSSDTAVSTTVLQRKPFKVEDFINNEQRKSILLVEDNEEMRLLISDHLAGDFLIHCALNGLEGLEQASKLQPNLIISDIMMPKMDGLEFCKNLRNDLQTSHIPILFLTAKATMMDKLEGLHLGADDYLAKPFDANELKSRTRNLIHRYERIHEYFSEKGFIPESNMTELTSKDQEFLKKLTDVIQANYDDEEFGVENLSAEMSLSRSQLHRKLKALTNHSPNEMIRNYRLQQAKTLLEKQVGNASEIAYMVGFNSLAYFSKSFKDCYGLSPSQINNKNPDEVPA